MRVGVLVDAFPVLSETFVVRQVAAMVDAGYDVTVYGTEASTTGRNHPDIARARLMDRAVFAQSQLLYRVADRLRRPYRVAQWLRSLAVAQADVLAADNDVLLCHFGHNGSRAARLKRRGCFKGRIVTVFHGFDLSRMVREQGVDIYAELFAVGDLFLPVSAFFRDRLIAMACPAARIRVMPMGVDCQRIAFQDRPHGPSIRLLFVGRLVEKKGLVFALRALAALKSEPAGAGWSLDVAGEGALRPELEREVAALGLTEQVRFLGATPSEQVLGLIAAAHIVVLPSVTALDGDQEGVPVVLMEAMASGATVVATRHSGIPELVRHSETGLLVEERDVPGLAATLSVVMRSAALRARLARAARRHVELHFNACRLDEALIALLADARPDAEN